MTNDEKSEVTQLLTDTEGRDLTADELQNLMKMFVAETTCAEREKVFLAAMEGNTDALHTVNATMEKLADATGDQEIRLKLIEEDKDRKRKNLPIKLTGAALILGVITNLPAIANLIKSLTK